MNNLSGNLIFCIVIFGAVFFLFIHNLFTVVFKIDKRNLDEERSKQLTEKNKPKCQMKRRILNRPENW